MSENQNTTAEETESLEVYPPQIRNLMRRLYRWRVLYGIAGFLFGMVKCIIDIVAGSQN